MKPNRIDDLTACFLDQDDDCHWFIIPEAKRQEWGDWLEGFDGYEEHPEWAMALGGNPNQIVFRINLEELK